MRKTKHQTTFKSKVLLTIASNGQYLNCNYFDVHVKWATCFVGFFFFFNNSFLKSDIYDQKRLKSSTKNRCKNVHLHLVEPSKRRDALIPRIHEIQNSISVLNKSEIEIHTDLNAQNAICMQTKLKNCANRVKKKHTLEH